MKIIKGVLPLGIIAVLATVLILFFVGGQLIPAQITGFNGCTWQPTYTYVTCQEIEAEKITLAAYSKYTCPNRADVSKCIINNIKGITNFAPIMPDNCASCGVFSCADCSKLTDGSFIQPGRIIVTVDTTQTITVIRKELRECGAAACSFSGIPISGAEGCTWPGKQLLNPLGLVVDTVPAGQSYKYVSGQTLVSCPQTCKPGVDDLSCTVPSNTIRSGTTIYNNYPVRWYSLGTQVYTVGCKQSEQAFCTKYNADFTQCVEEGKQAQCGVISIASAGSCSQNSDCGDTTRFACDWNDFTKTGTCKVIAQVPSQQCSFDFDCTQTAPTCNAKLLGGQKCIEEKCQVVAKAVQCCSISDCPTGSFCNAQNACEGSEVVIPPKPDKLLEIIVHFITSIIFAAIILVIIYVGGFIFPPLRIITMLYSNPKGFVVASLILGTLLFFITGGFAL